MFVDASALVAMVLREPEAQALADRLETALAPITSPLAVYETVLAIARQREGGVASAREDAATPRSSANPDRFHQTRRG